MYEKKTVRKQEKNFKEINAHYIEINYRPFCTETGSLRNCGRKTLLIFARSIRFYLFFLRYKY